jgi:hypothetical protein
MIVSKKEFLSNINEWCWEGSGRVDLMDEWGAFIPEEVCATYTKWLGEWVQRFNAMDQGIKVELVIDEEYYRIRRIIVKDINFPKWNDIEEEEYMIESEKAGEISQASRTDEETDEDSDEDSEEDE